MANCNLFKNAEVLLFVMFILSILIATHRFVLYWRKLKLNLVETDQCGHLQTSIKDQRFTVVHSVNKNKLNTCQVVRSSSSSNCLVTIPASQVIFVVGVNIQGLFIFWFHCARIQTVRRHWINVVVSCSTRFSDWSRSLITDTSTTLSSITNLSHINHIVRHKLVTTRW